jgi:hypothetical protein
LKPLLILAILAISVFPLVTAQQSAGNNKDVKKWPEWECVRWTWAGDVYNRHVVCLEWRKRENRWIP